MGKTRMKRRGLKIHGLMFSGVIFSKPSTGLATTKEQVPVTANTIKITNS